MTDVTTRNVSCLGCGCACDDLTVRVVSGRITAVEPPCPLALAWFGDGGVPSRTLVEGREATVEQALAAAAELLAGSRGRGLVYVGADLSSQAQRIAIALADLLYTTVDGPTSATAAEGLLAAQRRGRAGATLGEVRNRSDVVLCWAVDPTDRYPRYFERYAPPNSNRALVSVSIGEDRGPSEAVVALSLTPDEEITALSLLRAAVLGHELGPLPPALQPVAELARRLLQARYVTVVHDAEPGREPRRDPHCTEGLIALTQTLNGPTRAALSSLRAGGNRSGLESALTWQTGYPMTVEFTDAGPRYTPGRRGRDRGASGEFDVVLVAGTAPELLAAAAVSKAPTVVIGPRASESGRGARVAIDTGVAGIHESGTAYRMDEVPLPLTPPLPGGRGARDTLEQLLALVRRRLERKP